MASRCSCCQRVVAERRGLVQVDHPERLVELFGWKSYSFVDSTARLPSGATTASPTRVMPTSAAPSSSRAVDGAGGRGRLQQEASFAGGRP